MNLKELQSKVVEYSEDCTDGVVESTGMRFMAGRRLVANDVIATMNDWSARQIGERLDAPPFGWLWDEKHCPSPIAADLMNKLVKVRDEANYLVRYKANTVRAILSDSYTKFDNVSLVDLTVKAIDTMGIEPDVVRVQVGDDLHAYVLFPDVTMKQDPRDGGSGGQLHPAVHISNSERGGGAARITSAVYTGFCSNGLIYGFNATDTLKVRHRFVSEKVMGVLVANALSEALELSEEAATVFVQSEEVAIPQPSLKGLVGKWATRYGLAVDVRDNWLSAIVGEATRNGRMDDPRLFDVVNGATLLSQQYEPALAMQMERMAGDLLADRPRSRRNNNTED